MSLYAPLRNRSKTAKKRNHNYYVNYSIMFDRIPGFKRQRYATATYRSPDPTGRRSQMRPNISGAVVDFHFWRVGRQSSVFSAPPGTTTDTNIYLSRHKQTVYVRSSNYIFNQSFALAPVRSKQSLVYIFFFLHLFFTSPKTTCNYRSKSPCKV